MVDSSCNYDTTDRSYKALKAYTKNDTASLKQLDSFVTKQTKDRENWDLWKSYIPLRQLKQLETDEAYRVIFSIYGTPSYEVMTVYKKDTQSQLHYLFYKRDRDASKFDNVREFEKIISQDQWREFTYKIRDADYWGLKNDKEYCGDDENDLTVIGNLKSGDY